MISNPYGGGPPPMGGGFERPIAPFNRDRPMGGDFDRPPVGGMGAAPFANTVPTAFGASNTGYSAPLYPPVKTDMFDSPVTLLIRNVCLFFVIKTFFSSFPLTTHGK